MVCAVFAASTMRTATPSAHSVVGSRDNKFNDSMMMMMMPKAMRLMMPKAMRA